MKLVEENGYGKMVDFFEMTQETFEYAINEVLTNLTYVKIISYITLFQNNPNIFN